MNCHLDVAYPLKMALRLERGPYPAGLHRDRLFGHERGCFSSTTALGTQRTVATRRPIWLRSLDEAFEVTTTAATGVFPSAERLPVVLPVAHLTDLSCVIQVYH